MKQILRFGLFVLLGFSMPVHANSAGATWRSSSLSSFSKTVHGDDYQKAHTYLRRYYRYYRYSDYRKYLFHLGRYKQQSCQNISVKRCSYYKKKAQAYLRAYRRCYSPCYYKYYLYYIKKYQKCKQHISPRGSLYGMIFSDINCNGYFDRCGDRRLAGIRVYITDAQGNISVLYTNKRGYYRARNIIAGDVTIDIDDSSLPAGYRHVIGKDPNSIHLKPHRLNWAGIDGYAKGCTVANLPPKANNDTATTSEDSNLSITLSGSDEDNDTLTYKLTSQPAHGTLSGTAPNIIYTPNTNYNGTDSFSFTVNDGKADSDIAKIDITVTPVNDAPVAIDDSVSTEEDTPVIILPLTNDSDPDGNSTTLRVISASGAEYGSVLLADNKVYYTPRKKGATHDHILYRISDEYNATDTATIHIDINVTAHNDAPIAYNQILSTPEDTEISIDLNGSDPDGDSISYTLINTSYVPAHGTLTGTVPHLVYHPQKDFFGEDYIVFTASDGQLESPPAVITIRVIPRNDPPIADAGEDYEGIRGDLVHFDGSGSYDIDGNITSYVWREGNTTLSTQPKFEMKMLDEGTHTVTLTVTDDHNATDSDQKIITINPCCQGCIYPDPTATNPFN